MGKKKKNKSPKTRKFATAFKDLLETATPPATTDTPPPSGPLPSINPGPVRDIPRAYPVEDVPMPQVLNDDDLFAQALDQMSPKDVFSGKYMGEGHAVPKPPVEPKPKPVDPNEAAAEQEAREQIESLRDEAFFEHMVGPVEIVQKSKYRAPNVRSSLLNPKEEAPRRGFTDETPETLYTPLLDKDGEGLHFVNSINDAQRGLLKRYKLQNRRESAPQLNLHGDSQEDALRQLELFVHKAWKDKVPYIRIIHGKGLGSENQAPVIKPTVLHWLEGPGLRYIRGYAPELTTDRNYGSLVVAMDAKRQNPQDL